MITRSGTKPLRVFLGLAIDNSIGLTKMNDEQIEQFEKKQTAYHEAGHVVAHYLSGSVCIRAYIFRNERSGPDVKTWLGQCSAGGRIDAKSKAIVGLSGVVAEAILDDPNIEACEIVDYVDGITEPSATDWQMLSTHFELETFGRRDWQVLAESKESAGRLWALAEDTIELLKADWALVEKIAKHLVDEEGMTNGDLDRLTRQ